ncbi:MAG: TrmB family transcriptional regulator [Thaumarchaeota archaeon]|nr:TrmB family transcriptional regulator [Nitrososphaerota archaeon]
MQDQEITSVFLSDSESKLYPYKAKMEQVKGELLKFGLSQNQAKVFIYLGKYGPKSAPETSKALDIPRTETYFIINTLQNKGIVTAEFSTPVRYSTLPIGDAIVTLVKSEQEKVKILAMQEQELTELWNGIPAFIVETSETRKEKMQMLQGTPQINSKIKNMIGQTREEIFLFCTEKDFARFYYADFLELLSSSAADFKVIISPTQRMPEHAKQIDRNKIRIMPGNRWGNLCFLIRDSDEVLFFLRNSDHPSHNVFAMWADSPSLIASMHMLFELCWTNSENVY